MVQMSLLISGSIEPSHQGFSHVDKKQSSVEFEPSEEAYDASQANFSSRRDDTSHEIQLTQRPSEAASLQKSEMWNRDLESNPSDSHYDSFQQSANFDDNARRQSWSKAKGKIT